jgi:hypothetical protein
MNKEWFYDTRKESYESFFDHKWSKVIYDLTDDTKLKQPAFDLSVSWRGAANTFAMPWLLATMVQNTLQEKIKQEEPHAKKYITLLKEKILSEMRVPFQRDQKKDLQRVMEKLYKKSLSVCCAVKQIPIYQPDEVWKALLNNYEFNIALLGSQRMCFGSVYYAYEDYLRQCLGLALAKTDYRIRGRNIEADFTAVFSKSLFNLCWSDREVSLARITRNALVHNGCRETEDLKNAKHKFHLSNGEIQIMPDHTRYLFHSLKDRVIKLTVEALKIL